MTSWRVIQTRALEEAGGVEEGGVFGHGAAGGLGGGAEAFHHVATVAGHLQRGG